MLPAFKNLLFGKANSIHRKHVIKKEAPRFLEHGTGRREMLVKTMGEVVK